MYEQFYHLSAIPFQLTPGQPVLLRLQRAQPGDRAPGLRPGAAGRLHRHHRRSRRRQDHAGRAALVAARPQHLRHGAHRHHAGLRRRPAAPGGGEFRRAGRRRHRQGNAAAPVRAPGARPARSGRRCLLVVDEVQNLPLAALEELRMLSNITVDGKASVQTILLGQPQFRPIMASPDLEQLRQRVLASYHLGPLTEAETRAYIEHRLRTSAGPAIRTGKMPRSPTSIATPAAFRGGSTRCARACCCLARWRRPTRSPAAMVEMTASELNQDLGAGLAAPQPAMRASATPIALIAASELRARWLRRIEALEAGSRAKQDRVFRRRARPARAASRPTR